MTDFIKRFVIQNVAPAGDNGHFPARRAVNETVSISADIFVDGHDRLVARLLYRRVGAPGCCFPAENGTGTAFYKTDFNPAIKRDNQ